MNTLQNTGSGSGVVPAWTFFRSFRNRQRGGETGQRGRAVPDPEHRADEEEQEDGTSACTWFCSIFYTFTFPRSAVKCKLYVYTHLRKH